jgi:hypothetical protein
MDAVQSSMISSDSRFRHDASIFFMQYLTSSQRRATMSKEADAKSEEKEAEKEAATEIVSSVCLQGEFPLHVLRFLPGSSCHWSSS